MPSRTRRPPRSGRPHGRRRGGPPRRQPWDRPPDQPDPSGPPLRGGWSTPAPRRPSSSRRCPARQTARRSAPGGGRRATGGGQRRVGTRMPGCSSSPPSDRAGTNAGSLLSDPIVASRTARHHLPGGMFQIEPDGPSVRTPIGRYSTGTGAGSVTPLRVIHVVARQRARVRGRVPTRVCPRTSAFPLVRLDVRSEVDEAARRRLAVHGVGGAVVRKWHSAHRALPAPAPSSIHRAAESAR